MKIKLKLTMLVIFACAGSQLPASAATVSAVTLGSMGDVTVTSSSGKPESDSKGSDISTGSTITTTRDADTDLDLVPGASTVLFPETDVKISSLSYTPGKSETVDIDLTQGTILCNLTSGGAPCTYCVVTPRGTVTIPATLCTQGTLISYSEKTGLVVTKVPFPDISVNTLLANIANTSCQQTVSCNL